ncbi:TcfC E-set like domain-containing protein [Sphingomonas sp.]|uniref:TcfC E-set like domain-containing protein n=1 Tax=Sphingomonas sp. TaxID=28214 RepID=UPI0026089F9C|nr:TcfC E-set like domain-containing protein [Sphingomonas sp.]MDF2602831.1 hypothetical protein [Sphingomonas sp.]
MSTRGFLNASSALLLVWSSAGIAQERAEQAQGARLGELRTGVPAGFEDVDASLSTQFDLVFQQQILGGFAGTVKEGRFRFDDPEAVARALGATVVTAAAAEFLAQDFSTNEQFRCRPGVAAAIGCGILPAGISGVIVDVDSFSVSLFLPREVLVSRSVVVRELGDPYPGFSLIQNIQMSAASQGGVGAITYGGTFTTLASVGRNALIARTTLTDVGGFRSEELYAQRLWGERRAALGLLQDYQTLTLNSYRMVGGEFGSYFGTLIDPAVDTATPIEVLLPRRAQVEIYRYGVLVTSGQYEAGLQLLDTRALPDGTYSVQVIARDGEQILLDQTRTFSRLTGGVPMGKTGFRIRAGQRVRDTVFSNLLASGGGGFFPTTTGEMILSGALQRRLSSAIGAGLSVTSFDERVFGEATVEVNKGRLTGLFGGGVGSGGAYSALISGSMQLERVSFFLTARRTRVDDAPLLTPEQLNRAEYQPYYTDQDTIFGSIQSQVLSGAVSVNGSYSRNHGFADRYTVALQYTRQLNLPWAGGALMNAVVSRSNFDTRVGVSISFFKRVDRKTNASFNVGGQYVSESLPGSGRNGFSPVADAKLTRYERISDVDVVGELGAATDADSDRATARVVAASRYGAADVSAQWQSRAFSSSDVSFQSNVETGFAFGGGALKLGLRNPAEAMVLVDLTKAPPVKAKAVADVGGEGDWVPPPQDAAEPGLQAGERLNAPPRAQKVAEGGYRITLDGRPFDYAGPGSRTAIGVAPLREYVVGLKPEGAPEFDLDATQRPVTLYPGNVARVRFQAQRVVTIFGQIVSNRGTPLASARVEGASDVAITDDRGFFTVTAPADGKISVRAADGTACVTREVVDIVDLAAPALLHRAGVIPCAPISDPK